MILNISEYEAEQLKLAICWQADRLNTEIMIINGDYDYLDKDDPFYSDNVLNLQCRREIVDQQLYTLGKLYKQLGGDWDFGTYNNR